MPAATTPHPIDDDTAMNTPDSSVFADGVSPDELQALRDVWDLWQMGPKGYANRTGREKVAGRGAEKPGEPLEYVYVGDLFPLLLAKREQEKRQLEYERSQREDPGESNGRWPRHTILRMPPPPLPLPPCLQCAVAGVCCSLTTEPYALGLANDDARHSSRRMAKPAMQRQHDPHTSFALIVEQLKASCTTFESFVLDLTRARQRLEQQFLMQAIIQGATDSPFLRPPPDLCDRCRQDGESACLQQTMDLTRATVARPAGMPAQEPAMEVAWFGSSGTPPLCLLPQHASTLADQIRVGHAHANMKSLCRYVQKNARLAYVPLEAVYCRDPTAMTAKDVVAKTQALLATMEQKRKRHGEDAEQQQSDAADLMNLVLRPATRIEISRMLPRKSPINVYAGHGVATAYQTSASTSSCASAGSSRANRPVAHKTATKMNFTHAPWDASAMMANTEEPEDTF